MPTVLLSSTSHNLAHETQCSLLVSVCTSCGTARRERIREIIQGRLDTILKSEGRGLADLTTKALKDNSFASEPPTKKQTPVRHSGMDSQTHIAVQERVSRSRVILP